MGIADSSPFPQSRVGGASAEGAYPAPSVRSHNQESKTPWPAYPRWRSMRRNSPAQQFVCARAAMAARAWLPAEAADKTAEKQNLDYHEDDDLQAQHIDDGRIHAPSPALRRTAHPDDPPPPGVAQRANANVKKPSPPSARLRLAATSCEAIAGTASLISSPL
jgi:hypothetical protein